jgi:hypothetical protein
MHPITSIESTSCNNPVLAGAVEDAVEMWRLTPIGRKASKAVVANKNNHPESNQNQTKIKPKSNQNQTKINFRIELESRAAQRCRLETCGLARRRPS